jgi:uncharacterized protein (TIGR02453 family)
MKKTVVGFLTDLAANNNREWFQENKAAYEEAKREVEQFVNLLIPQLGSFDERVKYLTAKDCMFRIFRDVRFSKDKSPYKTNMGAWITGRGRKSPGPGYYLHIQPGESFLAAGVYMPEPEQLKMLRKEIYYNISEFLAILADPALKSYFGGVDEWDKAKTAPKDFPKDFEQIEILKNRHYTISCPVSDEQVMNDNFLSWVSDAFRTTNAYNRFLLRALEG